MEEVLNSGVRTLLVLVLPIIGAATITGILVGALLSAAAIQDAVVGYACKLGAVAAIFYLLFPLYRDSLLTLFRMVY